MLRKKLVTGLMAVAFALAGVVVSAPTASAATIHGCPEAHLCFYFNSNFAGARADYLYSDGNLSDELFTKGGTNGRGVQVKNNAASVVNNWSYPAVVYFNSRCDASVAKQTIPAYGSANLNATMKNNNASFNWPSSFGKSKDCASRDQF